MKSEEVRVKYRKEKSKIFLTILASQETQGDCTVLFPISNHQEEFDIGLEPIRTFEIVSSSIIVSGHYIRHPDHSKFEINYLVTEDGELIGKKTIENFTDENKAYHHMLVLEKA